MSLSDSLLIGTDPGVLDAKVIVGFPWSGEAVLYEILNEGLDDESEVVIPWEVAPDLVLPELNWTLPSQLDIDTDSSTPDAVAVWSMTAEQTAQLRTGLDLYLTVNGEVWFMGEVRCLS